MIEVVNTWGEGPDIMLCCNEALLLGPPTKTDRYIYGMSDNLQIDLNKEQAIYLIGALISVVYDINEIERQCNLHDSNLEREI